MHTEPQTRLNVCSLTVAEHWCPRNPKKCKPTMSQTHIARNTTRSTRSKLYDQETLNQKSSDDIHVYIHTSGKNWWQRIAGHKLQPSKFNNFQKIGTAVPKMCFEGTAVADMCRNLLHRSVEVFAAIFFLVSNSICRLSAALATIFKCICLNLLNSNSSKFATWRLQFT